MTVVIMKTSFRKLQPNRIKYQNYRAFSNEIYREDLTSKFSNKNKILEMPDKFLGICIDVLNQHAPCKTKMFQGNQCPFMNKELLKEIMTRKRL